MSLIKKESLTKKELKIINQYSRHPLTQEDISCFSVKLADNEINKDNEQFTVSSLYQMVDMLIGKTIFINDCKCARIFDCRVNHPKGKNTKDGQKYYQLIAKAFVVKSNNKTANNIDLSNIYEADIACSCRDVRYIKVFKDVVDVYEVNLKTK